MGHELLKPYDYWREPVAGKPWSERKRAIPLCTWSGRVVYEKKKHFFTIRDIERISKKVVPPVVQSEEDFKVVDDFVKKVLQMFDDLIDSLLESLGDKIIEYVTDWLAEKIITFLDLFLNRKAMEIVATRMALKLVPYVEETLLIEFVKQEPVPQETIPEEVPVSGGT